MSYFYFFFSFYVSLAVATATHTATVKVVCGVIHLYINNYNRKKFDTNEKQKDKDDLQHFCVYPYLLHDVSFFFVVFRQKCFNNITVSFCFIFVTFLM